jgi:hypothetical protein
LKIPFKKQPSEGVYPVARKRAKSMSSADLYNWTDALMYGAGRNLSYWRRGYGDLALREAEVALLQLLEVTRELRSREK